MARDTDLDWSIIATHQPFFGVLSNEKFLAENLTPEAIDEFYATGRADIDYVAERLREVGGGEFQPAAALDFGCGVGRLSFAMTAYAKRVVGVDVALDMLRIANEQSARAQNEVEFRATAPEGTIDWLNSLIVFQHIPPDRGHAIMRSLVELVAPGGYVSIQLPFYRDQRHVAEVTRDLAEYRYDGHTVEMLETAGTEPGGMSMYDYDMNRVLRILFQAGFASIRAEHTDHAGCHGAWLFGRRAG